MFTWRIELDASGRPLSCRKVDCSPSEKGASVFYVEAPDETLAVKAATRAQLASYKRMQRCADGLCARCGRKKKPHTIWCQKCSDRRKGPAPKPAASPPPPPALVALVRQPTPLTSARLAVLEEVHKAWLDAPNVGKFSRWLNAEIEKLQPSTIRRVS